MEAASTKALPTTPSTRSEGITGTSGVSPEEIAENVDKMMDLTDPTLMTVEMSNLTNALG
jgi:hypothetical protein